MKEPGEKLGRVISELLDRYELFARAAGYSFAQIDHMRSCVGLFDRFLHGIKDPAAVTADDFRRFLADLRDRPVWQGLKNEQTRHLSGTSINTYARVIKAFFGWLNSEGVIAENPLAVVPLPRKPKMLPKVYSETDLVAIIATAEANIRDNAVFNLFLDSGIRLAELARLTIGGVDTQGGRVRVLGKGSKERVAYFEADAAESIERYVRECRRGAAQTDFLFLTDDGHPLTKRGVQSLLLRLGKKAGIKERLAPHKLRHSFATLSVKYGANLEYVRKILGHADIKTTSESYLHAQDADVKAAHSHFSPLSNLRRADIGKPLEQKPPGESSHNVEWPKPPGGSSPKPTSGGSTREGGGIEVGDVHDNAHAVLQALHQQLYREHLQKLTDLTKQLVSDIESDNLEEDRKATTGRKTVFGGLGRVYRAQNNRLWPFLLQHLDSEFGAPPLGPQIWRIAFAAFWARFLKKESAERSLADSIRAKLVLVSERGTFKGTCRICEGYFHAESK